jgi:hypothetical protein
VAFGKIRHINNRFLRGAKEKISFFQGEPTKIVKQTAQAVVEKALI